MNVCVCVFGAGVAFDPLGIAVGVMFFFPDGYGGFDGIDDRTAGIKRGVSVGSGDSDANGEFAHLQMSRAVHAAGADDVVLRCDLLEDARALFYGQFWVGLVFE